jgi:hypothetical protein
VRRKRLVSVGVMVVPLAVGDNRYHGLACGGDRAAGDGGSQLSLVCSRTGFGHTVLVRGDAFSFGFLARGAIEPWRPAAHGQNEVVTRAAAAAAGRYAAGGRYSARSRTAGGVRAA